MWVWIVDRWLTWRTGKPKQVREFEAWWHEVLVLRADTPKEMFRNFTHVFTVDYDKFFFDCGMFMSLEEEVACYMWPQRALGDNTVYKILRGYENAHGEFYISDLGDEDRVYVATNNSKDAIMIALKYG